MIIVTSRSNTDFLIVQVAEQLHVEVPTDIRYINHSCDPNTDLVVSCEGCSLIAKKDIAAGEAITLDYTTSGS
jgi:hypothetical protein